MSYDEKPKKPQSYYLKWRNQWLKDDKDNDGD